MMLSAAVRFTAPLLAAAGACAAGCASLELPLPERTERAPGVAITVEEVPAEDAWRVYYSLDAPAAGLELGGGGAPFRREAWGVAVAGAEASWRSAGGRERLCFSRPARVVSVSFRAGSVPPPEEPGLALAWSDGSRVLDTGHLLARPLESCDGEGGPPAAEDPAHRFTFRTTPGRAVRLPGAAAAGELRWEPPAGGGAAATWVYFGAVEPVEGGAATVLLDPGLPTRLRSGLAEAVPRLAEDLGARADAAGPAPLFVLVAWGGEDGPGASIATAARPGVLLASARGAGWREEDGGERPDWHAGIARGLFRSRALAAPPPEEGAAWLPEAASEYLGSEAAVAYGGGDEAEAGRRLVARANDCLVRLGGRNLPAAAEADPEVWGSCGTVAMAAADGALRRGTPPRGLAALFGRLFEHAAATGGYDARAFLGGLQELGAEPRAVADLRWLLRGEGAAEGDRFLQRLLGHAGLRAQRVAPEDALAAGSVEPDTLGAAVARALGRCYCGAGEGPSCDPAATGRGASALAGEPIAADPRAAWDRLRAAIARGAALPVTLAGEEVTLFCTEDAYDPTWTSLLAPPEP
ncbi:MAG TPA: hypothetical protein VF150_09055 [Thermoanaerobaculia bacterium]